MAAMTKRDPVKARERKRRFLERQKVAKYGPDAVGKDMRGRHGNQRAMHLAALDVRHAIDRLLAEPAAGDGGGE